MWFSDLASLVLKDIPVDWQAQLQREADANFRSLDQEAIARIQSNFDFEERQTNESVNQLLQEAMDSGPEEPFTKAKFDAARQAAREKFAPIHRAA